MITSFPIPGDETSPVRISIGEVFTGFIERDGNAFPWLQSNDVDAIGINLIGGQTYRITLDPANPNGNILDATTDPRISGIINASGVTVDGGNANSGSGLAATQLFTPSATGLYFILSGPSREGWYNLQVTEFTTPADDFSNALDPSNPISIWETQDGHIGTNGDTDTIAISLQAGVAVDITVYGNDIGFFGELADAEIVSFVDAGGVAVDPALLDQAHAVGTFTTGGGVDAAQLSFTPSATGIYYITVGAGPAGDVGDYSVSVSAQDRGIHSYRANEEFVATGNPEVDMFFLGHSFPNADHIYTDRNGDGVTTLTYSVPGGSPGFSPAVHNSFASEWTYGYAPPTGVILDTWLDIISDIENFTGIDFVEVPDSGLEAGNFRIATTQYPMGGPTSAANGWAGLPEFMMAGETWLNLSQATNNVAFLQSFAPNLDFDEFMVGRVLHEFSHTLGLFHPNLSSVSATVDPMLLGLEYSVASTLPSALFSVPAIGDLPPQTLMWLDIQALHAAYGVNTTATAGDDAFFFDTDKRAFKTLWDYAGTDTLMLSGSANVTINLKSGTWQDVGTEILYYSLVDGSFLGTNTNTVFIAPDTVIENLQAGTGDDSLRGNSATNEIVGNSGNDTIFGVGGDDTLRGNAGSDRLEGGDGNDTLVGGGDDDVLRGDGGDDLVLGGSGDDTVTGQSGNDDLRGGTGNDQLRGLTGMDTLAGEDGDDFLAGQLDNDEVSGGAGNDTVKGNGGDDTLDGGAGNDTLFGGHQNDMADGGADADTVAGNSGNDTLLGGDGNDRLRGNGDMDSLNGGDGADDVFGGDGADILLGGAGNDLVRGGKGADRLEGNDGNDTLNGQAADDTIIGGNGDDSLRGSTGDDLFVFASGDDNDIIEDFVAGVGTEDVIELAGFGTSFDEFADVLAAASDDGMGNTVIDFGGGNALTLEGVIVAELHQDDFIFS